MQTQIPQRGEQQAKLMEEGMATIQTQMQQAEEQAKRMSEVMISTHKAANDT